MADAALQEEPIATPRSRAAARAETARRPPRRAADAGAVAELREDARRRREPRASSPAAPARTPKGMALLVELAELLQAPVQRRALRDADELSQRAIRSRWARACRGRRRFVLGLEVPELFMNLNAMTPVNRLGMAARPLDRPGTKIATINVARADHQEQLPGHRPLRRGRPGARRRRRGDAAGAHRGLPAADHADRRRAIRAARRPDWPRRTRQASSRALEQAAWGWDASPISTARLSAETVEPDQGRGLVARLRRDFVSNWPHRLWDFTKHYQFIGWSGGVRHRLRRAGGGRRGAGQPEARPAVSVNIQCDGDLQLRAGGAVDSGAPPHPAADRDAQQPRLPPGADVHHRRRRQDEARRAARRHRQRRSPTRTSTTRRWPRPTASTASGQSTKPADLGPALERAIEIVKRGEPALVDVVTQPR